jgi:hypothetical protein
MSSESIPPSPSPERPPLAPHDPPDPAPQAAAWDRALRVIALGSGAYAGGVLCRSARPNSRTNKRGRATAKGRKNH